MKFSKQRAFERVAGEGRASAKWRGGGLEEEVDPKKTRKEERGAERGRRATGGEMLSCTGGGLGLQGGPPLSIHRHSGVAGGLGGLPRHGEGLAFERERCLESFDSKARGSSLQTEGKDLGVCARPVPGHLSLGACSGVPAHSIAYSFLRDLIRYRCR